MKTKKLIEYLETFDPESIACFTVCDSDVTAFCAVDHVSLITDTPGPLIVLVKGEEVIRAKNTDEEGGDKNDF